MHRARSALLVAVVVGAIAVGASSLVAFGALPDVGSGSDPTPSTRTETETVGEPNGEGPPAQQPPADTPGPTADETADHPTDPPTDGEAPTATATDGPPDVAFSIETVDDCGRTCRIMEASVTNDGATALTNVTLEYEVYADDDRVWEGTTDVGRLGPGETVTRTERVDVGLTGGLAIEDNDGYVTIETAVVTDQGQRTDEHREQVT